MIWRLPILGAHLNVDGAGFVVPIPYTSNATNDLYNHYNFAFLDSNAKRPLWGKFTVPANYVDTPKIIIEWTATIISGNVVWDFDATAVGGNDTESLDPTAHQMAVTVTDAAPAAANRRLETSITLTAGDFAVHDAVNFVLSRDGANASDTMAASALLFGLFFEYEDS